MSLLPIVFYTFCSITAIQLVYYIIFSRFAFANKSNSKQKNIPVSIIICAKNEAENLKTFLPSIIEQDYPEFEIVLINDASYDDTLDVMKSFGSDHLNIKIVDVENNEAFWGKKKYALTLGIKAATHNFLLFTDADCKPVSKHWIKEISSHFSKTKTIVLGYGAYKKKKLNLLNKLIRFETLMTAVQYFSYAKIGMPYMGVGRNLAYRREEFFNANGFMSHMDILSGDDDLFINQIATGKNTAIAFEKDSFTESVPDTSLKDWFRQKRRHVSTSNYYKSKHKFFLGLYYISQVSFWVLAILLLSLLFQWKIVLGIVVFRILIQYITIGFSAKKLNETDVLYILPFLEVFLILAQLVIFISNLISKPNHWR